MQLKRFTAICLIAFLVLSFLPVFAVSENLSYDTIGYSSYTGYMNNNSDGVPDPNCGMGNNTTVTYNNVSPGTPGQYKLSLELIGVYGENSTVIVLKDGVELFRSPLTETQTRISLDVGEAGLASYDNCLAFKFTDTESVYFTMFTLSIRGVRLQYTVNADSANRQSDIGITDNKPSEGMNTGRYAEYDIDICEDGTYMLSMSGATVENIIAEVVLTIEDEYSQRMLLSGTGWYNPVTVEFPCFELDEGEHTFNITIASEAMRLFSLNICGTTSDEASNFMSEIFLSQNTAQMDDVLNKYDNVFVNNYKSLRENIIYRDFCYKKIRELNTDSFAEFNEKTIDILRDEINEPIVWFERAGKVLTTLTEGDFDVHIAPKFSKRQTAIIALYNNNSLSMAKQTSVKPYEEATIEGMYTDGNETMKLFFWNNLESLTPVELPTRDTNIFVSPYGDDSASGGYNTPIRTIHEATERVREANSNPVGDVTVNFMPGEYFVSETLVLTEEDGGKDGKQVTYRSFDKDNPAVISGGVSISGWMPYKDGIYMAQTDGIDDLRQFYVNGYPAVRARGESVFYASAPYDDPLTTYAEDGFVVKSTVFPKLAKPQNAEICYNILWTLQRLPVSSVVYGDEGCTVRMDQPYYSYAVSMKCEGGVQPIPGMQFFVENDLTLLDEEGEFYFDKETGIIYYYPFKDEDLSKSVCVAPVTQKLICAGGSSPESKLTNISFENLAFRYGAYTDANIKGTTSFQAECLATEEINVNPSESGTGEFLMAQIEFANSSNITFRDCDISCMGSTAIRFGDGTNNSRLASCLMRDNGGSAVSVGSYKYNKETSPELVTGNITIENNIITRPGIDFMFCPAVSVYYANGVSILGNDISCTPYSGISVGWGWGSPVADSVGSGNHNISGNRITDVSNAVRDGGHIYLLGGLSNTVVSENFISDSTDYGGIYLDSGSKGITIENNVCEKCNNWLFGGNTSSNVNVKTNFTDGPKSAFVPNDKNSVIYTEPVIYENSSWKDEALRIYNKCTISDTHFDIEDAGIPDWRESAVFRVPRGETLMSGEYLMEAEDYSGFQTRSGKTEPSLNIQGFRTVMGDIRQFDIMEYEIDIAEAGDYALELRYTTGPYVADSGPVVISILVDDKEAVKSVTLPFTNTKWAASTPYIVGTVSLKKGINKLSIRNLRNGFSYDSFKLIKQ